VSAGPPAAGIVPDVEPFSGGDATGASVGGVAMGMLLATLGLVAGGVGADLVFASTFAEGEQRSQAHGPFGPVGSSEATSRRVSLAPARGLVLLAGGLAGVGPGSR